MISIVRCVLFARRYHAADVDSDGLIQRSEFERLLQYLVYFNNRWHEFEAIDR